MASPWEEYAAPSEPPAAGPWQDFAAPAPQPASPGFLAAVGDQVKPVLNAFGRGFGEGWGPDQLGISAQDVKALSKAGFFAPEGATRYTNPFHAFNELLSDTVVRGGQIVTRGLMGTYRGAQAAGVEIGLHRDIVSVPDAFMGSPHPTGMPGAAVARTARMSSIEELAKGYRPATMPDLMHARELGVIGPEVPRLTEGKPAEAADRAIQPTVAYHGSPHDFPAFSTEKIGTGEGAQAYGYGLYFGEARATARSYQLMEDASINGRPFNINDPFHKAVGMVDEFGSREAAIKEARARQAHDPGDFYGDVLIALESAKPLPEMQTSGNMYQVRIHANVDHFLDWDKPFSEQAAEVKTALSKVWGEHGNGNKLDAAPSMAFVIKNLERKLGKEGASAALNDAGMPGIKYLDQGSRRLSDAEIRDEIAQIRSDAEKAQKFGQGAAPQALSPTEAKAAIARLEAQLETPTTRNFVVFSDKDVQITHKNGEPVEPVMSSPPTAPAPRERAMAADRAPDDVLKGPEPGGEPTGNPWRDRFDSFVGKLKAPEDVQNLIRDAATENENFPAARNGDIPLAHVESIAEAAGVAPDTIDRSGLGRTLKNDNQTRIAMRIMLQTTEDVKAAAREVKADGSPESLIKLQEAMMRRDLAVEQIVGLRAEWGRTGNVFQEFLRDVKDQESLNGFLKGRGRTPADLQDIARAIDQLDSTQAARVLSEMRGKTPSLFYWTWVQGLISGLLTHSKYVAANALYAASEHGVVTPIAAAIGRVKQLFGAADVEKVFFGEAMAATYGMIAAVPTSFMATAKSIYSGQRAVLRSEIEMHKEAVARGEKVPAIIDRAVNQLSGQGRPEMFQNSDVWGRLTAGDIGGAAKDAAGRALGAPGDVAMGIHTFFKILGERAALEAEAYRAAAKEGLSPAEGEFWRRRSEHAENPTSEMRDRAIASAYKGTFMNELGPHGRRWQQFSKETPGLRWLFPFAHIPLNLMKATYEATPFAFLDGEMRATLTGKNGGIAQDRAVARMVAGSAIMAYFTHQAMNGRATGDYPNDPKERDSWKLQGKQPNSILIGGYWVSFSKFGPAGSLANLSANIGYVVPHIGEWWTGKDEEGMTKATFHAAVAAGRLVTEEVGFLSLHMLFEAMHDEKKGTAWAANTAGSFLPFSSAIGQTASGGLPFTGGALGDPYMREAHTFIDGLKYRIPGQRETLQPKRDWLGEPMPNPQYGNIMRQRLANTSPLNAEMDRLQIHPGLPQDRIGGVKLTPKLYDEYQVYAGAMTKQALDGLVNNPVWQNVPTSTRITTIHSYISSSRQIAASMMQARHPELIGQGNQQRIDFITGKTLTPRPKHAPEAAGALPP